MSLRRFVRFALAPACLALSGCLSCPAPLPPPPPPACPAVGGATPCQRNIDCPGGSVCMFDVEGVQACGACERILCTSDADCAEDARCDGRRGACEPLFQCDPAGAACGEDEVCLVRGDVHACTPRDALPAPAACRIVPGIAALSSGAPRRFDVVALDARGARLPFASLRLASTSQGVQIDGDVVRATCEGPEPCDATFEARTDDGALLCEARASVFPPLEDGDARVVVVDADTGAPLQGAAVAVRASSGALLARTDARGAALFVDAGPISAASAFPDGYAWLSLVEPGAQDLVLPVARALPEGEVAGFEAPIDFSRTRPIGDVQLGLAGASFPDLVDALSVQTLLGTTVEVPLSIDGVTEGEEPAEMASAGALGIGFEVVKPTALAFGAPGLRAAWSIAGRVRLAEMGPALAASSEGASLGEWLLGVVPLMHGRMHHAVRTGLVVPTFARPDDARDQAAWDAPLMLDPLVPETSDVVTLEVEVPPLPCREEPGAPGVCATRAAGALLVAAVRVPGEGLVPLGMAFAPDGDVFDEEPARDGVVDVLGVLPGRALVHAAPPHDGLEGLPVTIAILAVFEDELSRGELSRARLASRLPLLSEQTVLAPVASFPAAPRGSLDVARGAFSLQGSSGASFHRLRLSSSAGPWDVVLAPGAREVDLRALAAEAAREEEARLEAFVLDGAAGAALPALFSLAGDQEGLRSPRVVAVVAEPCAPAGDGAAPACVVLP